MTWYIYIEQFGLCYEYTTQALTREEALRIIDYNFVLGNLTHHFYEQKSLYLWVSDHRKVHLVPENMLLKFLEDHNV